MEKKALTKMTMANNASKVGNFQFNSREKGTFRKILGSYAANEQYSQPIFCVRCTKFLVRSRLL